MAAPARVIIGANHTQNTTELTESPTEVTTHINKSTYIDTQNNYEEGNGG